MIIPLPQATNQAVPRQASFTGGKVAQSTISMAGVRAPQAIEVDPRMAQAEGAGMAIAGKLMGQVSDQLYEYKMEQYEAQNKVDLANARLEMDAAYSEFDTWKETDAAADPRSWVDAWKEKTDTLHAKFEADEKYSPAARQAIGLEYKGWAGQSSNRIARDSAKRIFGMAREADSAEYMSLVEGEQYDRAEALLSGSKYIPADDKVRMLFSMRDKKTEREEQYSFDTEIRNVTADPRAWMEAAKDYQPQGEKDARRHDILMSRARGMVQDEARDATDQIYDEMAKAHETGRVLTGEDIVKFSSNRLSPAALEKMKGVNANYYTDLEEARRKSPEYQKRVFSEVNTMIDDFDPHKDGDDSVNAVLGKIHEMHPSLRAEYRKRFDKKRNPDTEKYNDSIHTAAKASLRATLLDKPMGDAEKTFNVSAALGAGLLKDKGKLMKAGLTEKEANEVAGKTKSGERKELFLSYAAQRRPMAEDLNPYDRSAFESLRDGKESWKVTDEAAQGKARMNHGEVLKRYEEWEKKNPNASAAEASKQLSELIGVKTSVNVAPRLPGQRKGLDGAKTSSIRFDSPIKLSNYGYSSDSTPDSYSSKGIGHSNNKLIDGLSAAVSKSLASRLGLKTGDMFIAHTSKGDMRVRYDDTVPSYDKRTGALPETIDIYRKTNGSNSWGGKVLGISKA